MASLLEAAEKRRAEQRELTNKCPVRALMRTMDPDDAEALDRLMRQDVRDMTAGVILQALEDLGFEVTFKDSALQAHRRRLNGGQGCECPR